jgi:hypothetical protein
LRELGVLGAGRRRTNRTALRKIGEEDPSEDYSVSR